MSEQRREGGGKGVASVPVNSLEPSFVKFLISLVLGGHYLAPYFQVDSARVQVIFWSPPGVQLHIFLAGSTSKLQYFTLLHEFQQIPLESHGMLEFHSDSARMVGISNSHGFPVSFGWSSHGFPVSFE